MESSVKTMILEGTAGEDKIPAAKIEFGRNLKVIILVTYEQELIRNIKTISKRKWNPEEKYFGVPYSFATYFLEIVADLRYIQERTDVKVARRRKSMPI